MSSAIGHGLYSKDMARRLCVTRSTAQPWRDRDAAGYGHGITTGANHCRGAETDRGRRHPDQLRGLRQRRRGPRRARARPRRPVAELAREHPAAGSGAARARSRPARPRAHLGAARRQDQHPRLRPLRGRVLREARPGARSTWSELDAASWPPRCDPVHGARVAAGARLSRGITSADSLQTPILTTAAGLRNCDERRTRKDRQGCGEPITRQRARACGAATRGAKADLAYEGSSRPRQGVYAALRAASTTTSATAARREGRLSSSGAKRTRSSRARRQRVRARDLGQPQGCE